MAAEYAPPFVVVLPVGLDLVVEARDEAVVFALTANREVFPEPVQMKTRLILPTWTVHTWKLSLDESAQEERVRALLDKISEYASSKFDDRTSPAARSAALAARAASIQTRLRVVR